MAVHQKLKNKYLLCGQRYDFDMAESIQYEQNWEAKLLNKHKNNMVLHRPDGSDYFVFPKGQYKAGDIPPLVVGRPGWDTWIICNGASQRKLKVVDISDRAVVYHQNHVAGYKPVNYKEKETEHNLSFLTLDEQKKYKLKGCSHLLLFTMVFKNTGISQFVKKYTLRLKNRLKPVGRLISG